MKRGVVLVGGGARGAYQAGVLKGITKIIPREEARILFHVICGASAGAVNGAFLASRAGQIHDGVDELYSLWENLQFENVLRTQPLNLTRMVFRWVRGFAFNRGKPRANYMLETSPVKELIRNKIDFDRIREHVDTGMLAGFAISATNYNTRTSITFFEASPEVKNWERSGRVGVRAMLRQEHLFASASLPLLFEPITIGNSQFGDGSIRQPAPLSPAIHLGSDRVMAISVQSQHPHLSASELMGEGGKKMTPVTIAGIIGLILNSAFFEGVDFDSERMLRINRAVDLFAEASGDGSSYTRQLAIRKIPLILIRPSVDPAEIALEHFHRFPPMLRFLMKSVGASGENGADLMSYLAFESNYTKQLLEMGVRDAEARADEIREFFRDAKLSLPSQVGLFRNAIGPSIDAEN